MLETEIIIGNRFNNLVAIREVQKIGKRRRFLFKCDCGNECEVSLNHVKNGETKSCGCLARNNHYLHGMSKYRFWKIWFGIKKRCLNKEDKGYIKYGAKGIKIYDKWLIFDNFKEDMYSSYTEHVKEYGEKNTSIDRINNNGNYEPSNCRWATPKVQSRNTSVVKMITFEGKTLCIADWAKELNVVRGSFKYYMKKYNITFEDVISLIMRRDIKISKRILNFNCEECGIITNIGNRAKNKCMRCYHRIVKKGKDYKKYRREFYIKNKR